VEVPDAGSGGAAMTRPLVFDADEVRAAVPMSTAIAAARQALIAAAKKEVESPLPWHLEVPGSAGEVHVKGAVLRQAARFAVKTSTGFPRNATRGLPTSGGFTAVFDAQTGELAALLLDDGYLTELRTGAAGAVALDAMAPATVAVVAIIGTGGQSRHQLDGLLQVRTPAEIVIVGRRADAAEQLARWLGQRTDARVLASADPEAAARRADAVITVTNARRPVLHRDWLRPGVHINAIGADSPGKRELDPLILTSADLVAADDIEQSRRLGELQGIRDDDRTGRLVEIGSILDGAEPARESAADITVADLSGLGAQDAAIAEAAWSALT
jgi:ornithine cyclodeaminase